MVIQLPRKRPVVLRLEVFIDMSHPSYFLLPHSRGLHCLTPECVRYMTALVVSIKHLSRTRQFHSVVALNMHAMLMYFIMLMLIYYDYASCILFAYIA